MSEGQMKGQNSKEEDASKIKQADMLDSFVAESFPKVNRNSRWMIRVLDGPNCGAQATLVEEEEVIIGSDISSSKIIISDPGVSKKHIKLIPKKDGSCLVKDLGSSNGTWVNGEKTSEISVSGNFLIRIGNSIMLVVDKLNDPKTIAVEFFMIKNSGSGVPYIDFSILQGKGDTPAISKSTFKKMLLAFVMFSLVSVSSLFIENKIEMPELPKIDKEALEKIAADKPFTLQFDEENRRIILIGHVLREDERAEVISELRALPFVVSIDARRLVLDDLLCKEFNAIITNNWPSVSIKADSPGQYVIKGFIRRKDDAEKLNIYMQLNFPYLDKVKDEITIEEVAVENLNYELEALFPNKIAAEMVDGDLIVAGVIPEAKSDTLNAIIDAFGKKHRAKSVRKSITVIDFTTGTDSSSSLIATDISQQHNVSGFVKGSGGNIDVMIDGQLVRTGDMLGNMKVIDINESEVMLSREGELFKIAFSQR